MTNEEILNEVQKNPQKEGYGEREVQQTGIGLGVGTIALGIISILVILIDFFFYKTVDYGKMVMLLGFMTAWNLYEGIKIKKRISIITGIICGFATFSNLAMYIGGIFR